MTHPTLTALATDDALPPSKPHLLPLGALLLAGSLSALAQTAPNAQATLSTVTVKEQAEAPEGKDSLRATETTIGKGKQQLRDIPQSITVVTERLIDDRNLDTMKEALKNTAGISFLAAEGGEEDIRLRGFSLQATGDVFVDGMRDPAFYERDTFNLDRLELLRGSASMLFGRGSTGGAVNLVNKTPRLVDEHQVDVTVGSHAYRRVVGDFNIQTSESSALRLNAMGTEAKNNGSGSRIDKNGIAGTYRWGIGERDEFSASLYHLNNNNGMNYGLPWVRPSTPQSAAFPNGAPAASTTVLPLDPTAYYGMDSDRNHGTATTATFTHTHRFDRDNELTTKVRQGKYERDQRASTVRLCGPSINNTTGALTANASCPGQMVPVSLQNFGANTIFTRGAPLKIQDLDSFYAQSDFSGKFEALGYQHNVQAGVDFAREKKVVYSDTPGLNGTVRTAFYNALGLSKPNTTAGAPNDGASINENSRVLFPTSEYTSTGYGVYLQDLVQIAPQWKLLGGLRYDHLEGDYDTFNYTYSGTTGTHGFDKFSRGGTTGYRMKVSELSKRLGVLFQPNALHSYHASLANSFNTSGDAYSLGATNVNTPPEQALNFEVGAKLDSDDRQWTTRVAAFRSTKLHERNTDPLVNLVTLSGKRHVAGAEVDITGRLTPQWEIYGSYMWLPIANIDEAVPCTANCVQTELQGDRPSLTPVHSGTVWSTYQFTPRFRAGMGLNFRGKQTPNRNPGWAVPGYLTADLMAEYKFDFDKLTLKANVSNITNKLYADQLYSGHYVPGAGRILQVTASLKF